MYFLLSIDRYSHDEYGSIELQAFVDPLRELLTADAKVHDKREFIQAILGEGKAIWTSGATQLAIAKQNMERYSWGQAVGKVFAEDVIQFRGLIPELDMIDVEESVVKAKIEEVASRTKNHQSHFIMFEEDLMSEPDATNGFIQGIVEYLKQIQIPRDDLLPYLKNQQQD